VLYKFAGNVFTGFDDFFVKRKLSNRPAPMCSRTPFFVSVYFETTSVWNMFALCLITRRVTFISTITLNLVCRRSHRVFPFIYLFIFNFKETCSGGGGRLIVSKKKKRVPLYYEFDWFYFLDETRDESFNEFRVILNSNYVRLHIYVSIMNYVEYVY